MPELEFYKPIVADGPRRIDAATEVEYHQAWSHHASGCDDLLAMALTGGLVADRLAWVFMAGYQAACRHAFPTAQLRSWVAYAASEDRKSDEPLPGVTLHGTPSSGSLSGFKTWIAAANTVEQLVVKVGTGPEARYFLIDRTSPGLSIDTGPVAGFLPELSQGRAHFEATPVTDDNLLDASRVRQFGLLEPLYIYAAFCGLVLGSTTEHDLVSCSHDCLDAVGPAIASVGSDAIDRFNLHKADARAQDLLVRLMGNRLNAAGDWDADQRLVAMYSKGIRRH